MKNVYQNFKPKKLKTRPEVISAALYSSDKNLDWREMTKAKPVLSEKKKKPVIGNVSTEAK